MYIAGTAPVLKAVSELAPEIVRCCLEGSHDSKLLIERAVEFGCQRLQLQSELTTDQAIQRAREMGLITNYFHCDDVNKAKHLFDAGVMALLTNFPGRMKQLVENNKSEQAWIARG